MLRDISFSFPPEVLRGLTARFEAGTLTAIIGPNGSGKSTLLRVCLGSLVPQSGEALLTTGSTSRPVRAFSARELARRVAFVPQHSSVAFPFSVREIVRLGLYASDRGGAVSIVDQSLRAMELHDRADDPFGVLSAGQQQRATLARAIAQLGPEVRDGTDRAVLGGGQVLLADEPVSAMDPSHALRAMDQLRRFAREGAAVVVVLHDVSLVMRYADHVLMLDREGTIAAHGPTAQTLTAGALESVFGIRFEALSASGGVQGGTPAGFVPVGASTTLPEKRDN